MNFKAAICPSCGGQLRVPDDRDSVKCMYCGSDIVVREAIQKAGGLDPTNYLDLAEIALNEGKYEEALDYCKRALELDYKNPEAWYLKGKCNGLLISTKDPEKIDCLINYGYGDMRSDFIHAIEYAGDNSKEAYKFKIATFINEMIVSTNNKFGFSSVDDLKESEKGIYFSWVMIYANFALKIYPCQLLELEFALNLKPDDITTLANIVEIYDKIIDYRVHDKNIKGNAAEIQKLTQKKNEYLVTLRKLDPSYTFPVIEKKAEVEKKHFWQ